MKGDFALRKAIMKKSKLIRISAAALVLILLCITAVYAYFSLSRTQSENIGIDPSLETITVSNFKELFFATQSKNYNDGSAASDTENNRKTVLLGADITLEADLEITADVHFDLGGKTLYLGGHTLTFRHSYHGSIVMANGTVVTGQDNSGATYADTPNAAVMLSDVTFRNPDGESVSGKFRIISAEPAFVAYNFFKTVAAAIADESQTLKERANYDDVKNFTQFTSADFIYLYKTDDCASHSAPCSYVFADVDLPKKYIGYPGATVSYTTEKGKISAYGEKVGTGDDTITATITIGGTTYSCDFYVHVPDISGSNEKSVVLEMAKRYISRWWVETAKDGTDTVTVQKYVINHDCYLPTKFGFSDLTVSYTGYDENNAETASAAEGSPFALFAPTHSTVKLTAKVGDGSLDFDMISTNVATVKNATTVANDLLKKWYGTEITVTVDQNGNYTYSGASSDPLSGYLPLYGTDYYKNSEYETAYPGINSIEYSVVYGDTVDEYYTIDDAVTGENYQRFYVTSGKHPENDAGSVYLNVKMNITYNGNVSDIVIQMPVRCYVSGDDGLSRFLPYYSVFNKNISEQTGGYTLESFDMPFNYRSGQPMVCYALSAQDGSDDTLAKLGSVIKIYFVDKDGNRHALVGADVTVDIVSGETSVQRNIISYIGSLESLGLDLREQAESGKAHFTVEVDTTNLGTENLGLALIYQYKLSYSATSWAAYDLTTDITVPGVLHLGTHVKDSGFYAWIYNKFNPNGKTYSSGELILTDWLMENVALDYASDTALGSVSDFTGLKYLVGTQTLSLSGATVTHSNIKEIAYMKSLTTVDLSNCNITVTASEASPFESWTAATSQLINLVSIDLRGNTIYKFDWLENLGKKSKMLAKIIVSDNVPSTNDFDKVFYGSDGLSNYGTYRELVKQGIAIYSGGNSGSPAQFSDSRSSSRLYLNLCSIEYQNKIPSGASLADVLSELSTSADDYGISTEASNASYSCTVTNPAIAYSVIDENTFSLTYSATANGTTYSIVLKFSVTRN